MNKYSHREAFTKPLISNRHIKGPSPLLNQEEESNSMAWTHSRHSNPMNLYSLPFHRKSSSTGYLPAPDHPHSISSFTKAQNDIVSGSLQRINEEKRDFNWFPDVKSSSMLRTDHDFNKIINKLNRVIFPDTNKRPVFLNDSEYADFCLDENQTQLCKVYTKGKKTPLIMKIQRFKGKVLTYVSFYDREPGPNSYDRYYSTDYFEIRENIQKFKYEYIYFSMKAVDYSEFRVQITFGKISDLHELKKLRRQLSQLRPGKVSTDSSPVLQNTKNSVKDFISLNKSIKLLNSNLNAPELKQRAKDWEKKHKEVIGKKKVMLIEKLSKHQMFLNRQEIRKKVKQEEELKRVEKEVKIEIEQRWMSFLYLIIGSKEIRRKIQENRGKRLKKIDINIKAIRIQRIFRGLTKNLDKNDKAMMRARNNLLMFNNLARSCIMKQVKAKLLSYILVVARDYITSHKLNV